MAAVRFTHVKRLQSSIQGSLNLEYVQQYHRSVDMNPIRIARFPSYSLSHLYSKGELQSPQVFAKNQFSSLASESRVCSAFNSTKLNASFHHRLSSSFCYWGALPFALVTYVLNCQMYSSSSGGKGGRDDGTEVAAGSGASNVNARGDSIVGGDLAEKTKDAWKSVVDTATHAGQKVKETSDELTLYAHPYLD